MKLDRLVLIVIRRESEGNGRTIISFLSTVSGDPGQVGGWDRSLGLVASVDVRVFCRKSPCLLLKGQK